MISNYFAYLFSNNLCLIYSRRVKRPSMCFDQLLARKNRAQFALTNLRLESARQNLRIKGAAHRSARLRLSLENIWGRILSWCKSCVVTSPSKGD